MYSAIWSEAAASHVREIVEYMRTENPLVARKLAHAFALFTDLVEHMPEIAPVWKENSRYRIWFGIYPYKIFYVIDEQEEQIFISAVRHGKRQNPYLP